MAAEGELADQPAVREVVVEDNRIAVVAGLAVTAEPVPEGWPGRGTEQHRAVLGEDLEGHVDPLQVVVAADIAVGVGRQQRVDVAGPLDAQQGRRRGGHPEPLCTTRSTALSGAGAWARNGARSTFEGETSSIFPKPAGGGGARDAISDSGRDAVTTGC